jgi:glucose/mannose-6-phosphate isomerase
MDLDVAKNFGLLDKRNMLSIQMNFLEDIHNALDLGAPIKLSFDSIANILVVGMGGSGISGEILKVWLADKIKIPIDVIKDYILPHYVDSSSFIIFTSFSGNTEETLSCFYQGIKCGAQILSITSGGLLEKYSKLLKRKFIKIPSGRQPRSALPYLFFPLIPIFEAGNICKDKLTEEVDDTCKTLETIIKQNSPNVPSDRNPAKNFAKQLKNKIPVIYAPQHLGVVGLRMRCQLNENSKVLAFNETLPEMNHNGIMGWEDSSKQCKNIVAILLRSKNESEVIKERIECTKEFAIKNKAEIIELWAQGKSRLSEIFSLIFIGDLISIYLALLYDLDPSPVNTITKLKQVLSAKVRMQEKLASKINKMLG